MAHQANDLGNHELPLDRERPPGPTPAPAAASPPCLQHTHPEQGHSTTGTARLTPGSGLDTWKGCERRPVPRAQGLVQLERVPASKGARCRQAAPPQVTWELYRWTVRPAKVRSHRTAECSGSRRMCVPPRPDLKPGAQNSSSRNHGNSHL